MGVGNITGFICRMNALIMYIGNISLPDPLLQHSTIPLFQLHVVRLMAHSSGVKPMPGPLDVDFLLL